VLAVPRERRFLVYDGAYDWESSASRALPPDPEPDGPRGGHWIVEGRDGEVRAVYPELPDGSSVEDT
jgi:hypothetical protein